MTTDRLVRAAASHGAIPAVVAISAVVVAVPSGPRRAAVEVVLFLASAAGIALGVRAHRPTRPLMWHALTAALVCFGLSSGAWGLSELGVAGAAIAESALDIGGYLCAAVAAVGVLVTRRAEGDREVRTDLAVAGVALVALGAQWATASGVSDQMGFGADQLGLMLMNVALLVVVAQALFTGHGNRSLQLLVLAVGVEMAELGAVLWWPTAAGSTAIDAVPVAAAWLAVLAALHPSMVEVATPTASHTASLASRRWVSLAVTLVANPIMVWLWAIQHDAGTARLDPLALGLCVLALSGLGLWRVWQLIIERERSRAAVEASEARLHLVFQHAADVIAITASDGTLTSVSPAAAAVLGHTAQGLVGHPVADLAVPEDRAARAALLDADGAGVHAGDIRVREARDAVRWVEVRVADCRGLPGVDGHILTMREVTDRRAAEEQLTRAAFTDPLTGLANRRRFTAALAALLDATDGQGAGPGGPAVLFCDLDDFQDVNDRSGHAAGDRVLVAVADRLRREAGAGDGGHDSGPSAPVVARLGGDEVAILVPAVADQARLVALADRLLAAVDEPIPLGDGTAIRQRISLGGAVAAPGDAVEDLIHHADRAMYEAKAAGKGRARIARRPVASTRRAGLSRR